MRKTLSKRLPGEHFSCPPDLFSWCGDYMIAVVDEDFTLLRKEPKNTLKLLLLMNFRQHQSLAWDRLSCGLEPRCHTLPVTAFLMSLHGLFKGPKTWGWGCWMRQRWKLVGLCLLSARPAFFCSLCHFSFSSPRKTRGQSKYKQESKQRNGFYRSLGFTALGKCVYLVQPLHYT